MPGICSGLVPFLGERCTLGHPSTSLVAYCQVELGLIISSLRCMQKTAKGTLRVLCNPFPRAQSNSQIEHRLDISL